jgi:hypothetical protein
MERLKSLSGNDHISSGSHRNMSRVGGTQPDADEARNVGWGLKASDIAKNCIQRPRWMAEPQYDITGIGGQSRHPQHEILGRSPMSSTKVQTYRQVGEMSDAVNAFAMRVALGCKPAFAYNECDHRWSPATGQVRSMISPMEGTPGSCLADFFALFLVTWPRIRSSSSWIQTMSGICEP